MFSVLANMALLLEFYFCLKSIAADHIHFMSYDYIIYIPTIYVYLFF